MNIYKKKEFKSYSFKELYIYFHQGKNIYLETPDGPKKVIGAYKKYGSGKKIIFDDNSEIKAANFHLIMSKKIFIYIKDLKIGDSLTGGNYKEIKKIKNIEELKYQEWYDFSLDYEKECYIQNNIIHHNSGKSFVIYSLIRWYNIPTLIIVPTITLVHQMYSDFQSYGCDVDKYCHKIFAGEDKETNKLISISTWQSIYKNRKKFFDKFRLVIGDECISADSKISMSNGEKKDIQYIQEGDLIKTFNEEKGTLEDKPVLKVHRNLSIKEEMYEIEIENDTKLKITGNHKVMLTTGEWKRVDQLEIGEIINSIE